jgi:iron complex outermembrane receptor protein
LEQAPAAVSVVTSEDIQRLGITTFPDALRLVPGMDVARIDSHSWAVSARGFNAQFANKLLILMDGRTIYGPAYGGVNWGMQDTVMEDVDRIEVIRGPGASLWGANAVNGVVNIMTKSARDTQGVLASVGAGTEDQPSLSARYGGTLASNVYYRVYGKAFWRDGLVTSTGEDAHDDWQSAQGGARMDWEPSDIDKFTLQGSYYNDLVNENQNVVVLTPPFVTTANVENNDVGGNVLARWTHQFSESSALNLQAYYDRFTQEQVGTSETRDTADFDFQHSFNIGSRNAVIWGAGYRYTADSFPGNFFLTWIPPERQDDLYSAFVQDDITIIHNRVHLTLGSKFEHNDYTGFEYEPTARLLWTPSERQTFWAAGSRAVRTPSRYETGARVNYSVFPLASPPFPTTLGLASLYGNANADSEQLTAIEAGYRIEPTRRLSLDFATFYNQYDDLLRFVPEAPFVQGPLTVFRQTIQNSGSAETYGIEFAGNWKVTDWWRVGVGYSWLHVELHPNDPAFQGNPAHQAQLRSYWDLPGNLEFNGALFYVDETTAAAGLGTATIPAYVRLDVGLVWHPTKSLRMGIWGKNLLDDRHPEFPSLKSSIQTEIPREIHFQASYQF